MERITCAAIWIKELSGVHLPKNIKEGYVITGHRHCNCIETFSMCDPMIGGKRGSTSNQGFLTSENRYVDRIEAKQIAREAGQLLEDRLQDTLLFSEDIY